MVWGAIRVPIIVEDRTEGDAGRQTDLTRRGRRFDPRFLLLSLSVVIVAWLALIPLIYLVITTFSGPEGFSIDGFVRAYKNDDIGNLTLDSTVFTVGTMIFAVVVGGLLALVTERTAIPFRNLIRVASVVPVIIPGILYTIAWALLLSPESGALNHLLGMSFDIYSLPGMIFVQGLESVPFVYLLVAAALRAIDPSLEEAASVAGAGVWRIFGRVTSPLVTPALVSAILIVAIRTLEAFEIPTLLGTPAGIYVYISRIYQVLGYYPTDYGQAGAYSVAVLLVGCLAVFLNSRISRSGHRFQTVGGKAFRPRLAPLGRAGKLFAGLGVLVYFIGAVILPSAMLVYVSTQPFYRVPSFAALSDTSLASYTQLLDDGTVVRSFRNSILLAVGAAILVMMVTTVASWITVRSRLRGKSLLDGLMTLPLAVPGLVFGLALLFVYVRIPLPIYGSLWILLIAYSARFLPYGSRYVMSAMFQIHTELEESAQISGATWLQTFRRVILPLLSPGVVAGGMYVMMVSMRELASSLLLYTPGHEVLAITIWDDWQAGRVSRLAAVGVVMIAIFLVLVGLAQRLGRRVGVRLDE